MEDNKNEEIKEENVQEIKQAEEAKQEESEVVNEENQLETQNNIEQNVKKCKSNKLFVIIIVVIAMALTFGSGMILGHKLGESKKEKKDEPKENEVVDNNQTESKDTKPSLDDNTSDKNENIEHNQDNQEALSQIDDYNNNSEYGYGEKSVSLYYINRLLSNYINKELSLDEIKSVEKHVVAGDNIGYSIKVNDEKNIEVKTEMLGNETFSADDYINYKIIDAERDNDYVYVYRKVAFARYNTEYFNLDSDIYKVDYYDNYKRTGNIVETLNSSEFTDRNGNKYPNSEPNWNLYKTYKYTFKLIGEEYYFESIELV